MIPAGSFDEALEWALNRVLAADPEVQEELGALAGKRIRIAPEPFPPPVDLVVRARGVSVRVAAEAGEEEGSAPPDLTLSGPALALVRFALGQGPGGGLPESVTVSGDLGLAQRLRRLIRRYRFDAEEVLSRYLGDVAAHEVARQARSARDWARGAVESLSADLAEYLVEESRMVAEGRELARFADAVDALRDDLERLDARVAALSRRAEGGRA